MKKLQEYFENARGLGVLATADSEGKVDTALYSRPHFLEEGTLAFIMRDRLTHHNLQSNPYASYLFVENGEGTQGKRLFLKKVREEDDQERIDKLKRRKGKDESGEAVFLVFFSVEKELPLLSGQE